MTSQNIAIIGADHGSEDFLRQMLQLQSSGVNVVAVYGQKGLELNSMAETVNIKRLNLQEIVSLGDKLDIIFDLSGDRELRMELRKTLFSSDNKHSIIAPESIAQLMFKMMGSELTPSGGVVGY